MLLLDVDENTEVLRLRSWTKARSRGPGAMSGGSPLVELTTGFSHMGGAAKANALSPVLLGSALHPVAMAHGSLGLSGCPGPGVLQD